MAEKIYSEKKQSSQNFFPSSLLILWVTLHFKQLSRKKIWSQPIFSLFFVFYIQIPAYPDFFVPSINFLNKSLKKLVVKIKTYLTVL